MRVQLSRLPEDDGAVAVTVALLSLVLLVMAAFAMDFGMAFAQRRALATGADSAALAIAQEQFERLTTESPRPDCADLISDPAAADALALTQLNANKPFGQALTDDQVTTTLECVGAGTFQATVRVAKSVDTTFGRLAGVDQIGINRTAAAAVGVQEVSTGYFPLGICENVARGILKNAEDDEVAGYIAAGKPYRHELISVEKLWKDSASACITPKTGAGNWGWLTCGSGGSGVSDAVEEGACTDTVTFVEGPPRTATIASKPGNNTSVDKAMELLLPKNKVVVFPVYQAISKSGRADYEVVGFLSARICAYEPTMPTTGSCYGTVDSWLPSSPNVALTKDKQGDKIQIQFVKYATVAQLGSCGIGDTGCDFQLYRTQLTK